MSTTATAQVSIQFGISQPPNNFNNKVTWSQSLSEYLGPTPGAILIATTGTDVSLAQLTTPGPCLITNNDLTNYVTYGIKDTTTHEFYPFGILYPGQSAYFQLSPELGNEYLPSGTATTNNSTFHIQANAAAVLVTVNAFNN